jgi:ABC-type nitrate/sulfonate/bicarbonate transport system ATPase subunit
MMIDRESVISEFSDRLRNDRFVTLLGPGGIGKTTIALAVGHAAAEEFGGEVYLSTWKTSPIRVMLQGLLRHPWELHSNRKTPAWNWSTSFVRESFLSFSIAVSM